MCNNNNNKDKAIFDVCQKWQYKDHEFEVLSDGKVRLYDDILEPGSFSIDGSTLNVCAEEEFSGEENHTSTKRERTNSDNASILVGQVGAVISIIALLAHLVSFALVPAMRNLPGYNLASLAVAFLFSYLFTLIGQIPEVLGIYCVLSGILVQYFFLAAFFCMNTLAFDVWRTLRMATTQLAMSSQNAKRRQFVYYAIYSWGVPLIIVCITVAMDNIESVPTNIRPYFGEDDVCWMTNNDAKLAFFMAPAFTLFVANAIFFVLSAFIIRTNTMQQTSDEKSQAARYNYVLYMRLGIMMGVTWLVGVVATFAYTENAWGFVIWLAFDLMNSLQGLFLFIMFTCTKKVINHVREKIHLHPMSRTPKTSTSDLTGKISVFSRNS